MLGVVIHPLLLTVSLLHCISWYLVITMSDISRFGNVSSITLEFGHISILEVHLEVFFLYLMDATAFAYFLVCFALLCTTFPIQLNLPGVVSLRTRNLTNVRSSSRWQLTGRASYRTIPPTTLQNLLNSSDEKKTVWGRHSEGPSIANPNHIP